MRRALGASFALSGLVVLLLAACNQLLENEAARGLLQDAGAASADGAVGGSHDGGKTYADGGCVTGSVVCPGSPDCVDLSQDPAHCGACDRQCDACQNGACQPVRVGNGLDEPLALGLDGSDLFALTNTPAPSSGTLLRAAVTRGATLGAVITSLDRPTAMAVDPGAASAVFLGVAGPPGTSKVVLYTGSGTPIELKPLGGNQVGALDFDGGKLWGTDLKGGRVWQASPDGSNFVATNAQAGGLTLGTIEAGGGVLMVAMRTNPCVQPGEILRWSPGSTPATIGQAIPCPAGLALVGGDLYVSNRQAAPLGTITHIDATGTTTAMFQQEDNPSAIAADGKDLFWVDEGSGGSTDGSVNRAVGTTKVVVAAGRAHPVALAVSATHVYWAERGATAGTGAVYRIER